jgi:hypothetical protein
MLESAVDLLNGLFLIAMILLTTVCIVGSVVAALRAVGRASATSESIQAKFVDDMGSHSGSLLHTQAIGSHALESRQDGSAPKDFKSGASPQPSTVGAIRVGTYRS